MRCMACGSESAPGAKFCAACGKPMAPEPSGPPAVGPSSSGASPVNVQVHFNLGGEHGQNPSLGQHLQQSMQNGADLQRMQSALGQMQPFGHPSWPGPMRARGRFCPSCEQRTMPVPYFSRGTNVAKAVVLFPFTSFIGPLIFFLIRKNRVICSYCHAKLPGHLPVPLLDSFSHDGATALASLHPDDEMMVADKAVGQEIAVLERRSRRQRRRAWTLGVVTAGMATIGTANAVNGDDEANVVLFGLSGLAGVGALVNRQRGEKNSILAEAARQRQRVQEVLAIARAHAGKLNVTMVASQLHLDFREAEALLDSMVDGRRVDVQVDDQGRMNYVFPELTP